MLEALTLVWSIRFFQGAISLKRSSPVSISDPVLFPLRHRSPNLMKISYIVAGISFATLTAPAVGAAERPNIILIMADDLGYENVPVGGNDAYATPNLDALAAGGLSFRNVHSQPLCTPSRVQIMTGVYNNRNYIRFGLLDPRAVTFGQVLRQAGYKTCIAGKWQLGGGYEAPGKFGFDRYCLWQLNRRPSRYANPGFEIDGTRKDFKNGEFGPDIMTDYLGDFLAGQKDSDQPFFVYYPMMLTHWPFVPTPDSKEYDPTMWRDKTNEPGGWRDQKYWKGFVEYADKMVGKVIDQLTAQGLRDRTLVIFTGDNGTYTGIRQLYQGRMMDGGKGSTKDNGTRVPLIASWPGVIEPGKVSDALVDFTDFMPTLADAAGATDRLPEHLDGRSLVALFRGAENVPAREPIYCWYQRDGVRKDASQHVRTARHKLYADGRFYDTGNDPDEKTDLAKKGVPEELRAVHAMLEQALAPHLADTVRADPIQAAKRRTMKR